MAVLSSAQNSGEPIVVPLETLGKGLGFRAQVGGVERRIALVNESPYSYLKGAASEPAEVTVGGRSLGKVRFVETTPGLGANGEDGGLGLDVLKGMAVGIDMDRRQIVLWPEGNRPAAEAEAWVGATAEPGKVRRVKLGTLRTGSLSTEATVAGKEVAAILYLGFDNSILGPTVERPRVPLGRRFLLPNASVGGLAPSWLVYLEGKADTVGKDIFGVDATVSLDAFDSPRLLVDFAAKTLMVQERSSEARRSTLLTQFTMVPLSLRGDGLFVHVPPDSEADPKSPYPIVRPFEGSQVLRMADVRAGDWVAALRGQDEVSARRLGELLAGLFKAFRIDVLTPQGRELPINVPSRSGG